MVEVLDTVLLLALPASGKSEVRRFLAEQDESVCRDHFHLGPTAQLDDYPYVHMMRCFDDELAEAGHERCFFEAAERGFSNPLDWGTLIALLNEDYVDMRALQKREPAAPVAWLMGRFDRARKRVGADPVFSPMADDTRKMLEEKLAGDAGEVVSDWNSALPRTLEGKTIVIEFARGGPADRGMPLPRGFGYGYSLAQLSDEILSRSSILYVWVTPEQSRAKNLERARPDADGSILFHGVPEHVMVNDYGCDDMEHLIGLSGRAGTVRVECGGREFYLPVGRFDNRGDLTTFIREDIETWNDADVTKLRDGLAGALDEAWRNRT